MTWLIASIIFFVFKWDEWRDTAPVSYSPRHQRRGSPLGRRPPWPACLSTWVSARLPRSETADRHWSRRHPRGRHSAIFHAACSSEARVLTSGSAWIGINLTCWIRIRIQILNADPDPGEQKWPTKTGKSKDFSCFEVLDVLFGGLNASPVACVSFVEA